MSGAPIPVDQYSAGPNGYTSPTPLYSPPRSPEPLGHEQQFKGFYGSGNQFPTGASQGMAPMMEGMAPPGPQMAPPRMSGPIEHAQPNFGPGPGPLKPQPVIQEKYDPPIYGAPAPAGQTICGMRRKIFWAVLAGAIILIIAGLGAGLGIALSRKKSTPDVDVLPTTTRDVSPITPGPTSVDDPVTPFTTPPPRTTTPPSEYFSLETGRNTASLTYTTTSGNSDLCRYVMSYISRTTTIYPTIRGDPDSYTATWTLDNYAGTLIDVGAPPAPTETLKYWYFDVSINSQSNGCITNGIEELFLEESGVAAYFSGFRLNTNCYFGTEYYSAETWCQVLFIGRRS